MKYIKKFETHTEYETYINGSDVILPNVSACADQADVHYNKKPHDYSQDYLTFVALESGTFTFSENTINYSLDDGETWTSLASNTASPTVAAGNKIMWKATGLTLTSNGIGTFSATGNFDAEGNVMSLYYGDNFVGQTNLTGKNYAFYKLFNNNNKLISASNLILPATTLESNSYYYMFANCTSLTTAPELPATSLTEYCYREMFRGCTSLTTAPELPATTLADECYYSMFYGCTNLTTAPNTLPAMTLAIGCYCQMFFNCASLTTAPELPATTLADNCYADMFWNCTSLTTAPELPATTLTEACYYLMFRGCTGLTTAPELSAITLVNECYYGMFYGCTNLNSIKCLAKNISAEDCTTDWVNGVAASGTFTKASSMSSWTTGTDGIPSGWTIQNT